MIHFDLRIICSNGLQQTTIKECVELELGKIYVTVEKHSILLMKEILHKLKYTLPETNIAAENRPSQKETSIPTIHFQVLFGAMLVSGRVCILNYTI